ncbi:transcriptional regulator [Legionella norrlandica]|uniref:Transcriptional regulator n=1 Tax=Legionella norrlandica TaxID=1498499 RepID=A0A0A2SW77_9GAMM|nr:helix-turn-helix domain-containing protein [Legionella norrlandica]KGP63709.1 transcriptional regulator [Legionella norrlandica]
MSANDDNYNSNDTECVKCSFSPFCMSYREKTRWNLFNSVVKQRHYLQKQNVFDLANHTFRSLWVIRRGALKTYQVGADGDEIIRGFYFSGEILGFEAIYTNLHLYSAASLSETVICEIPYDNFLDLLRANPDLQKHSLYLISKQLNMGSYLFSIKAEQRLAAFLMDLSNRLYPLGMQFELLIPMTRRDIGNYLRLTAETISRLLSQFKDDKIITIDHKKIQLLQPEKLKFISEH